jgi:DNA replication ATP-dependent helicase Dna2
MHSPLENNELDLSESDDVEEGNSLTQGCSIEWGSETPHSKSFNLNTLFSSPSFTPRNITSSTKSSRKDSSSGKRRRTRLSTALDQSHGTHGLSTQPEKQSERKNNNNVPVEDEVDYIFGIVDENNITNNYAHRQNIQQTNECIPRETDGNPLKSSEAQEMSTDEFNAMLSGLSPKRREIVGTLGYKKRIQRRELVKQKRLFKQLRERKAKESNGSENNRRAPSYSSSSNSNQVTKQNHPIQENQVEDISFDDLLMELKDRSKKDVTIVSYDESSKNSRSSNDKISVQGVPPALNPSSNVLDTENRNEFVDDFQDITFEELPSSTRKRPYDSTAVIANGQPSVAEFEDLPSSTRKPLLPNNGQSIPNTSESSLLMQHDRHKNICNFEDIEFDDSVFAAVDEAVEKRQCLPSSSLTSEKNSNIHDCNNTKHTNRPISLHRSEAFSTSTKSNATVDENQKPSILSNSCQDFDDFPDIDVDAFDNIVERSQLQRHATQPDAHVEFGEFSDMDFDMIDNMVKRRKSPTDHISCSRYVVHNVNVDANTFTTTLGVTRWCNSQFKNEESCTTSAVDGFIHLRGEWFHTKCQVGDIIHICSVSGKYSTELSQIPMELNTIGENEDLVLIVHPDTLLTPTTISDSVSCLRRAVIQNRYGSDGLNKAALVGQMRHALFEKCLVQNNFTHEFVRQAAPIIVREHADQLIGSNLLNENLMIAEVLKILPNIQRFATMYTSFTQQSNHRELNGTGSSPNIQFRADCIHATEEVAMSTELGIKGFIDVTVEASIIPQRSVDINKNAGESSIQALMSVELKTGHNQTPQHTHMAQLSLYTLALKSRYGSAKSGNAQTTGPGAANGGMLLYLNHESINAIHVSPSVPEVKSLLNQRNVVATEIKKVSKPRGVLFEKKSSEENAEQLIKIEPATPADLPDLLQGSHSCERCYRSKECMLNAAVQINSSGDIYNLQRTHGKLLNHYTHHLDQIDLDYFKEWDRLIDLEASGVHREISDAWLVPSLEREQKSGKTISSLVIDETCLDYEPNSDFGGASEYTLKLSRSGASSLFQPLNMLKFESSSRVVVSTDGSSLNPETTAPLRRHVFSMFRATVKELDECSIYLKVTESDFLRVSRFVKRREMKEVTFRVDKDDFLVGTSTLRQNLAKLLTVDVSPFKESVETQELMSPTQMQFKSRAPNLRSLLIHLDSPQFEQISLPELFFSNQSSELSSLTQEFSSLNEDQKAAVYKVMSARDYSIIQGFPGTGKTSVIVFIARLMIALGKRLLVTSYTHAAVDNILLKLIESGVGTTARNDEINTDIVRIGPKSACHPSLHHVRAHELAFQIDRVNCENELHADGKLLMPSISSLHHVVSSAKIIGVSALTIPKSPLLAGQDFDCVVVDEAGQISQPATIGALLAGNSFVLVGDHEQLPPLVQNEAAEQAGYGVSMLKRLADKHPNAVAQLTLQYRMHEDICYLPNMIAYEGKLKCANDIVRTKKLVIPHYPRSLRTLVKPEIIGLGWMLPVLNPNKPALFVSTDKINSTSSTEFEGLELSSGRVDGGGMINDVEVQLIRTLVKGLIVCGIKESDIGVISPYRAQVNRLEEDSFLVPAIKAGLEVSTIDRYQGRDKNVVLVSMVRSNKSGKTGRLLEDRRRLNVAFSRAKMKLLIIGSYRTLLSGSKVLNPILTEMGTKGWVENLTTNAIDVYNI